MGRLEDTPPSITAYFPSNTAEELTGSSECRRKGYRVCCISFGAAGNGSPHGHSCSADLLYLTARFSLIVSFAYDRCHRQLGRWEELTGE